MAARLLTVEFGPSRSRRFKAAVAEAAQAGGACRELAPGRYRVSFPLDKDRDLFRNLARLLARVRGWCATEVCDEDGKLVSAHHACEMAWCASEQLGWFGECRCRFFHGVSPRCALCPLFPLERAVGDVLGENTPNLIEIRLPPRSEALPAAGSPPTSAPPLDPNWTCPDRPPGEWRQDGGGAAAE